MRRLMHALPQAAVGAFLVVAALRVRAVAPLVAFAACWLVVAGVVLVVVAVLNVYTVRD